MNNHKIQDEASNNPYLQMRNEKIARNQKRLLELGLLTRTPDSPSSTTSTKKSHPLHKQKQSLLPTQPLRRSARNRNAGAEGTTSIVDDGVILNDDAASTAKRRKFSGQVVVPENDAIIKNNNITARKESSSPSAPLPNNSVKSISLDVPKLVSQFLLTPLPIFGKKYVITTSFEEAAHHADKLRMASSLSSTKNLSFNKYCGVQEWKNAIYLWVNIDNDASKSSSSGYTNVFSKRGRHMTWYGGSKMREDSPIIQKLIRVGKKAASLAVGNSTVEKNDAATTPATSDADASIVLWCRTFDAQTKRLTPYTCFGRLSYVKHDGNSHPVAFEWNLLDYDGIVVGGDDEKDGEVTTKKGSLFFSMIGVDE